MKTIASVAVIALVAAQSATAQQHSNSVEGTWSLVSLDNKDASGNPTHPWGAKPVGTFVFGPDGHFAEIIINEEKANTSLDYFGTYSVEGNTLRLQVVGCSAPQFRDKTIERQINLSNNRLSYSNTNPSVGGSATLTWQRVQ
jgi:Lipocalin-like domain